MGNTEKQRKRKGDEKRLPYDTTLLHHSHRRNADSRHSTWPNLLFDSHLLFPCLLLWPAHRPNLWTTLFCLTFVWWCLLLFVSLLVMLAWRTNVFIVLCAEQRSTHKWASGGQHTCWCGWSTYWMHVINTENSDDEGIWTKCWLKGRHLTLRHYLSMTVSAYIKVQLV